MTGTKITMWFLEEIKASRQPPHSPSLNSQCLPSNRADSAFVSISVAECGRSYRSDGRKKQARLGSDWPPCLPVGASSARPLPIVRGFERVFFINKATATEAQVSSGLVGSSRDRRSVGHTARENQSDR
ncbi:hypothetical protein ElyMa_002644900 [Elysia marginata]|uniref:Uncharacterized protein n=1 Tax=Elysia marginata TaxID=1093978 RepID=A0AAV4H5J6_9GAST|nr:hypothetical protein ElyMa_002644900 [Elysia marginata]